VAEFDRFAFSAVDVSRWPPVSVAEVYVLLFSPRSSPGYNSPPVRLDETTSAPAVGLWGGSLRLPFIVRSLARLPRKCGIFACACVFADDTTGPCVRGPRKGQSLAAGAGQLHRVASMPAMLFGRLLVRWVRAMHGQICHRKPKVLLGYHHREQLLSAASERE